MARAHEHLASARYAEAAGAFRAVLRIDPNEFQAHFGLADALVARGQHAEAVEGLVTAAESCTAREDHGAALMLYGKALAVDPMRLELHLDVAMAEAALGRTEAAQSRLEHLAEVYMQAGRTDEAAEVYRTLAGWEGDGEEVEAEPAQPPREAVPMMVGTSETVVISTILITPDGQLLQLPIEQQSQAWAPASGDTVPPVPAELLEVVHSAPIDLAEGQEVEDVERTVVGYPPPPPSLPENYESAAHTVNRSQLEAAVVAALDNLAQLEEEDMTLIMQRLPPQAKSGAPRSRSAESRLPEFVTRSRMPKPELPPEPPAETFDDELGAEALEADADLATDADELDDRAQVVAERAAESKLRLNPAPRPVAKPTPVPTVGKASAPLGAGKPAAGKPAAGKPAAGKPVASKGAVASKASAPLGTGKPSPVSPASRGAAASSRPAAASGRASAPAGASKPAAAPARTSASASASKAGPARPSPVTPAAKATAPASKPAATPARASAPTGASKPAAAPARAGTPASASKPAPATSKPAPLASGPARPAAGPAPRSGSGSASSPPAEASKPTRPNNPLAERLRRRAGLQKPDAAPGRPAEPRPTEPITVRSPSRLPPIDKSKKK